jgi:hypothetical protein
MNLASASAKLAWTIALICALSLCISSIACRSISKGGQKREVYRYTLGLTKCSAQKGWPPPAYS